MGLGLHGAVGGGLEGEVDVGPPAVALEADRAGEQVGGEGAVLVDPGGRGLGALGQCLDPLAGEPGGDPGGGKVGGGGGGVGGRLLGPGRGGGGSGEGGLGAGQQCDRHRRRDRSAQCPEDRR